MRMRVRFRENQQILVGVGEQPDDIWYFFDDKLINVP